MIFAVWLKRNLIREKNPAKLNQYSMHWRRIIRQCWGSVWIIWFELSALPIVFALNWSLWFETFANYSNSMGCVELLAWIACVNWKRHRQENSQATLDVNKWETENHDEIKSKELLWIIPKLLVHYYSGNANTANHLLFLTPPPQCVHSSVCTNSLNSSKI